MHKVTKIISITFTAVIVIFVFFYVLTFFNGNKDFSQLVKGEGKGGKLEKLTFSQPQTLSLGVVEKDTVDFFIHELSKGISQPGYVDSCNYSLEGLFSFFSRQDLVFEISNDKTNALVGFEEKSGFADYYLIDLSNASTPPHVSNLINYLFQNCVDNKSKH